jgi:hypothetical protein
MRRFSVIPSGDLGYSKYPFRSHTNINFKGVRPEQINIAFTRTLSICRGCTFIQSRTLSVLLAHASKIPNPERIPPRSIYEAQSVTQINIGTGICVVECLKHWANTSCLLANNVYRKEGCRKGIQTAKHGFSNSVPRNFLRLLVGRCINDISRKR